jgi:hypothetical protein
MSVESSIIEYKICLFCKSGLVKFKNNYCSSCKKKTFKNTVLKFNKNPYFCKFNSKYSKRNKSYDDKLRGNKEGIIIISI